MNTTTPTPTSSNPQGDSVRDSKGAYFFVPDRWTTITAGRGLKATDDECEALAAALYAPYEDDDDLGAWNGGFDLAYNDDEVYVFAEHWEDCDWDELPQAFLVLLGSLIAKNGLDYLEFGAADVDYEPSMGIYNGAPAYFRIRSDGSIWEPTLTW